MLVIVSVLGFGYDMPGVVATDLRLDRWLTASTLPVRAFLRPVRDVSGPAAVAAWCVVQSCVCVLLRRFTAAALALLAPAAAAGLSDLVLKPLVARQASAGGFAYPSGHATAVAAVAAVLVLLAVPGGTFTRWVSRRARVGLQAAAGCGTAYVGISLVALGYHSVTDVVGGAALGASTACGLALLLDRFVTVVR
ncbi:MAG: hypothetical protein NVS3B26_27330 [Mycobacteriales bacterium]